MVPTPSPRGWAGSGECGQHTRTPAVRAITFDAEALTQAERPGALAARSARRGWYRPACEPPSLPEGARRLQRRRVAGTAAGHGSTLEETVRPFQIAPWPATASQPKIVAGGG